MLINQHVEPLASILSLLDHLSTQVVHPTYAPFLRLPVLHAVRVSMAWAALTRTRDWRKVGVLQDLVGYLTLAWGGSTLAALLQSTPPPWLISPIVWVIYPLTYLLIYCTSISSLLASIIGADILGAYIDGLTRGSTIASISIPSTLTPASSLGVGAPGRAILAAIATGGGGWIVHSLGMYKDQWQLGVPAPLAQGAGVLGTLDVWAAVVSSLVHSVLLSDFQAANPTPTPTPNPWLSGLKRYLAFGLDSKISDVPVGIQVHSEPRLAKAACVLVMASLLVARVITKLVLSDRTGGDQKPKSASTSTPTPTPIAGSARHASQNGLEEKSGSGSAGSRTSIPKKKRGTPKRGNTPK